MLCEQNSSFVDPEEEQHAKRLKLESVFTPEVKIFASFFV